MVNGHASQQLQGEKWFSEQNVLPKNWDKGGISFYSKILQKPEKSFRWKISPIKIWEAFANLCLDNRGKYFILKC